MLLESAIAILVSAERSRPAGDCGVWLDGAMVGSGRGGRGQRADALRSRIVLDQVAEALDAPLDAVLVVLPEHRHPVEIDHVRQSLQVLDVLRARARGAAARDRAVRIGEQPERASRGV